MKKVLSHSLLIPWIFFVFSLYWQGAPKPMKTSVEQKDGTWKVEKQS